MPTPRIKIILRWPHRLLLTTHLILLAILLLLWPLSHFSRIPNLHPSFTGLHLTASDGRLILGYSPDFLRITEDPHRIGYNETFGDLVYGGWSYTERNRPFTLCSDSRAWFGIAPYFPSTGPTRFTLAIPFSYLTLLLLIYPALTYRHHKKHRPTKTTRAFPLDPPTLSPPQD